MTTTAITFEGIEDTPLELETKTVTVREVYEALEHNGFEHLRSTWFGADNSVYDKEQGFIPTKGCVLAQTAFNLGVAAMESNISAALMEFNDSIRDRAWHATHKYTLYEQLNRFYVDEDSKWIQDQVHDTEGTPDTYLGGVIIHWNDALNEEDEAYILETYADVAAMAKEVMEPFFDETVELLVASRETGVPLTLI